MIRLKQLLFEQNETTTYQFKNSFADNIVIPVKGNQPNITAFSKITNINQLDANLRDFVNTLNAAVTSGILKSGVITITSEADGGSAATTNVPRGWTQAQVNFSYGNGATVNNQTLADRRAEGIEFVIRKFVKLPTQVTIQKSGKVGNKKSAAAVVPIATADPNTPREYTKSGKKEQFDIKSTNVYTPPAYSDAKIPVAKCNSNLNANGQRGNPIAYRSKLDATGKITINFSSYYIPDRLVITKVKQGSTQGEIVYDSGYVSIDPNEAQVTFGKTLATLNSTTPNGYNGKISAFTAKQVDLGTDNTINHFVEVYAPLGPTMWNMSIKCGPNVSTNSTAPIKIDFKTLSKLSGVKAGNIIKLPYRQGNSTFGNQGQGTTWTITDQGPSSAEITAFVNSISNKGQNWNLNNLKFDKPYSGQKDFGELNTDSISSLKRQLGNKFTTVSNFVTKYKSDFSGQWMILIPSQVIQIFFTNGNINGYAIGGRSRINQLKSLGAL